MNRPDPTDPDMPTNIPAPRRRRGWIVAPVLLVLAVVGWISRERAFATEETREGLVKSGTIGLADVEMAPNRDGGKLVGKVGIYFQGDTPSSTKFVTGRYVIEPKSTPHAPHTHAEEEVMIVESGEGVIFCDGKKTKVGPGSSMYTAPNVAHGIDNTGDGPLVFYFIKWAPAGSK